MERTDKEGEREEGRKGFEEASSRKGRSFSITVVLS